MSTSSSLLGTEVTTHQRYEHVGEVLNFCDVSTLYKKAGTPPKTYYKIYYILTDYLDYFEVIHIYKKKLSHAPSPLPTARKDISFCDPPLAKKKNVEHDETATKRFALNDTND